MADKEYTGVNIEVHPEQKDERFARESVFSIIHDANLWRDEESVSGRGSSLEATEYLRPNLVGLFRTYNIRTIADAPCGDFNWFRELDYRFERYDGYDIVEALESKNTKVYGTKTTHFHHADLLGDFVPPADVLLCRDLTIHLSHEHIFTFFANVQRSGFKYILLSQYEPSDNKDRNTGVLFQPIDFFKEPFCFPEPLELIDEKAPYACAGPNQTGEKSVHPQGNSLGFWRMKDILAALAKNETFQNVLATKSFNPPAEAFRPPHTNDLYVSNCLRANIPRQ
ncbi:MAG: hypothetical protein PHW76_03990 [Alphaproteobacteria bacterium]|nr:hypothetical protein [Alphaproteobacteria bacterium]